jgi:hypothetical protein
VDLLGLKRKARGFCLLDRWGDSSSNEGSSSTSTSGYTTAGSSSTSLGNISSGSSVQSYSSNSSGGFVQDAVAAGTAPGADPNSTQTTLAALSGVPSTAPVVSSGPIGAVQRDPGGFFLTLGRALLGVAGLTNPATMKSSVVSLGGMIYNGDYKKLGFGSAPPSTAVSNGSGAAETAAAWSGESSNGYTTFTRTGSSSSSYGSPVIGYQGALVNKGSPALATANLSNTPAAAANAKPAGVALQTQQQDGFPWGGLLLAVGAAALLS